MATAGPKTPRYSYSVEIAQMCFVFGETKEPDEEVVQYIEDIVRGQISEIVMQAKAQAARRSSRHLSVEDLIFLIRHDRAKVNRLRTYLSWKDVRKKVKDSEADEAPELETMEEPATDKALKAHRMKIKIPWEITNIFSEYLKEESDGEDDDEIEAYEDSKKRLKEADDLTRGMTKEQYQHYADCRQASFTYRKAKRFREFVNLGAYIDGNPNDEVMDVLGFLAYEMVRSLCDAGSQTKRAMTLARTTAAVAALQVERQREEEKALAKGKGREKKRGLEKDDGTPMEDVVVASKQATRGAGGMDSAPSTSKKPRKSESSVPPRSPPRILTDPISLFSEPFDDISPSGMSTPGGKAVTGPGTRGAGTPAFGGGSDKLALQLQDVSGGCAAMLQGQASLKASGMRNWRGGLKRIKVGFI